MYWREDTDAALDGLLAEQGGPMVGLEYVIPSWAAFDHQASEPADLFAITDRPIMEAFGLYREVALDTTQEVTSEFGPDEDLSGPGRWS